MSQANFLNLLAGGVVTLGAVSSATADGQQAWSSTSSADETRAIVAEMMADAENRSSLLQGGAAGYDNGFYIGDANGDFKLKISGQVQFRYYADFRDEEGAGEDEFESGFQMRYVRVNFAGNIVSPDLYYRVRLRSDQGADTRIDYAYGGYKFADGWALQWGQYKLPFSREELVGDGEQLAVERSLINSVFSLDYGQGISLIYRGDQIGFEAMFSDGANSDNSEFANVNSHDPDGNGLIEKNAAFGAFRQGGNESDYAGTARFEWKIAGDWDSFKDFTGHGNPSDEVQALFGVAGHIEGSDEDTYTDPVSGATDNYDGTYAAYTADFGIEGAGWNFFVAGHGSTVDLNIGNGVEDNFDDYGALVQGGIVLPNTDWELFVRYEIFWPDDSRPDNNDIDEFSAVTVGTNWYWSKHAAKFTLDVVWYVDDTNPLLGPDTSKGYLQDDDDGELTLRAQMQLLF